MFEAVSSREEYYRLVAQKIYDLRKEAEERRRNQRQPQRE